MLEEGVDGRIFPQTFDEILYRCGLLFCQSSFLAGIPDLRVRRRLTAMSLSNLENMKTGVAANDIAGDIDGDAEGDGVEHGRQGPLFHESEASTDRRGAVFRELAGHLLERPLLSQGAGRTTPKAWLFWRYIEPELHRWPTPWASFAFGMSYAALWVMVAGVMLPLHITRFR